MNLQENPVWKGLPVEFGEKEYGTFMDAIKAVLTFEFTNTDPEYQHTSVKKEELAQQYLLDLYSTLSGLDILNLSPIEKKFLLVLGDVLQSGVDLPVDEITQEIFIEDMGKRVLLSLVILEALLIYNVDFCENVFGIDYENTILPQCCIIEEYFYVDGGSIDWEEYVRSLQNSETYPTFLKILFQIRENSGLSYPEFADKLCDNIDELAQFFGDQSTVSNAALVCLLHFFELSEEQSQYIQSAIELPEVGEDDLDGEELV